MRTSWLGRSATRPAGTVTYSGVHRSRLHPLRFALISPTDRPIEVDTFNGNVVLVSRAAFERVGRIDGEFEHAAADYDYGLRAAKRRSPAAIGPGNSRHLRKGSWRHAAVGGPHPLRAGSAAGSGQQERAPAPGEGPLPQAPRRTSLARLLAFPICSGPAVATSTDGRPSHDPTTDLTPPSAEELSRQSDDECPTVLRLLRISVHTTGVRSSSSWPDVSRPASFSSPQGEERYLGPALKHEPGSLPVRDVRRVSIAGSSAAGRTSH